MAQGQFTCPEHAKRHQGSHPAWPDGRDAVAATLILEGISDLQRRGDEGANLVAAPYMVRMDIPTSG